MKNQPEADFINWQIWALTQICGLFGNMKNYCENQGRVLREYKLCLMLFHIFYVIRDYGQGVGGKALSSDQCTGFSF